MKILSRHFELYIKIKTFLFIALLLITALCPFVAFGADTPFVPLAGIPQIAPQAGPGLGGYLNQLYVFLIVIGAIFGAIKISIAGAKYALSDIITDKASAKKDIQGVLLGLAILLIPYVVLSTIYSGLTNLNILRTAQPVNTTVPANTGGVGGGAAGGGGGVVPGTGTLSCSKSIADPNACQNECTALGGTYTESSTNNTTSCTYPTIKKACAYKETTIPNPSCSPDTPSLCGDIIAYDDAQCKTDCAKVKGTFQGVNASSGQCTYPAINTP